MPFMDLLFNKNEQVVENNVEFSLLNLKEYITSKISFLVSAYPITDLLLYLCILIIITFVLKNIFSFFQTYFMSSVEQGIVQKIQLELYSHIHDLPISFFVNEKKGNLISRIINDVKIINDSLVAVINSAFRDPPQIITYSIMLFVFNWKLSLFIFALSPILGFVLSKIGDNLKKKSISTQEHISEVTSLLDETLAAMRIVKAFNMEKYEVNRFHKATDNYYGAMIGLIRRRALASPVTEIIGIVFITMILYFIGIQIVSGDGYMSPGAFVLYLGLIFQLMTPLKFFGQVFNSIKEGIAASERVFSILKIEPSIKNKENPVVIDKFKESIKFDKVNFSYDGKTDVLSNIDFEIKPGELIALVGASGAGKSTLIDLIPRFYDPTAGEVTLDGLNLKEIDLTSLRNLIGIVSQETILFNDTIKNNIAYGDKKYSEKEIIEAARAAYAHIFIEELENGYETIIGDRGLKLSGGQRQRIAIARAILKNPPILILDEATSALDSESEKWVQKALYRLMEGRTSIVIAHRLSTIKQADNILVIDKGVIQESGKHSELFAMDGVYKKLHDLQFK